MASEPYLIFNYSLRLSIRNVKDNLSLLFFNFMLNLSEKNLLSQDSKYLQSFT